MFAVAEATTDCGSSRGQDYNSTSLCPVAYAGIFFWGGEADLLVSVFYRLNKDF